MDRADSRRERLIVQLFSDTPQASYSSNEVAAIFIVAPRLVLQWVGVGRLKTWRTPGGRHRFNPAYLRQVAEDCGVRPDGAAVTPRTPKRPVDPSRTALHLHPDQENEEDAAASIRVEYLTVDGAAVYLGMSRTSIQRVINSGELAVDRRTHPFRIRVTDIDDLVERSLMTPGALNLDTDAHPGSGT